MASGDITRYVITVTFHEDSLTEINELNNHLTRSGFLLTLTDDEGDVHELGTNTFGFVSAQSADEIKALVAGLAKSALDKDVDITVATGRRGVKRTISAIPAAARPRCALVRIFQPHFCTNLMIWQTTWGETLCGKLSVVF